MGLFSWLASCEKGEKKPHPPGAFCEKPLYLLILPEIEFTDIFLKRNYDFFHAQFLDFHGFTGTFFSIFHGHKCSILIFPISMFDYILHKFEHYMLRYSTSCCNPSAKTCPSSKLIHCKALSRSGCSKKCCSL